MIGDWHHLQGLRWQGDSQTLMPWSIVSLTPLIEDIMLTPVGQFEALSAGCVR